MTEVSIYFLASPFFRCETGIFLEPGAAVFFPGEAKLLRFVPGGSGSGYGKGLPNALFSKLLDLL
jgi:hypothetical protein